MADGVGLDVSGVDRLGSGAPSWYQRDFPLVIFSCMPAKSENRNGDFEQGCKGKSIPNKSSLSDQRGVP